LKPIINFVLLLTIIFITGCATSTVPIHRVNRPWNRTIDNNQDVLVSSKISIVVNGVESPLLGATDLVDSKMKEKCETLLLRRGYRIVEDNASYKLFLKYRTDRADKIASSSLNSSYNSTFMLNGNKGINGLGVSLASSIAAMATQSENTTINSTYQIQSYSHTISIEIYDSYSKLAFDGDVTWDSSELDIMDGSTTAMQTVLCNLPSDPTIIPSIKKLKKENTVNFYHTFCYNHIFSCPALPYVIYFSASDPYYPFSEAAGQNPIKDAYALPAYIDLIRTAEYALPSGKKVSDWRNPADIYLWRTATLGGKYLIGPRKDQINVLINLTGEPSGYLIKSCRIVDDAEYSVFKNNYDLWVKTLNDYYDFYEK
jgi:hypothetical protein